MFSLNFFFSFLASSQNITFCDCTILAAEIYSKPKIMSANLKKIINHDFVSF